MLTLSGCRLLESATQVLPCGSVDCCCFLPIPVRRPTANSGGSIDPRKSASDSARVDSRQGSFVKDPLRLRS